MNAAIYLRVSSKDGRQDEANQEPACITLARGRGWEPCFYRERESGAKRRPVWDSLKEDCRCGTIGAVVFWALDRIGRNRVQIAHDVAELARWKVQVVSVKDPWLDQPAGPLRDLLLQIMAWVAEGERARLIERTVAGQARARAQGKRIGRPIGGGGKKPRVTGDLAVALRHLWRQRLSASAAAKALGLPRSTVRAWFDRLVAENGVHSAPGQPTQIRGL